MTEDTQNTPIQTLAILSLLEENIRTVQGSISEPYVMEFHKILDNMEHIGLDMSQFRAPESEVNPRCRSFNISTGQRSYSEEKYVEKPFLLTKVSATIKYIVMLLPDKAKKIGFDTPHNR